ncbi:hypothetical protein [Mucilaginibacter antarcticus]|uniref:hypothetical protein n=1 Tax=Mucilaginibacter antarcticus TaxID=1855725 RepID=UPI003633A2E9
MEYAIDQALKIYSGGLGFLSGSHLRSAFELKQNLIGIGMLWKYGYYDQQRDSNGLMKPGFVEKDYSFLQDTGVMFTLQVHNAPVHVRAFLLKPEIFGAAPLFCSAQMFPKMMNSPVRSRIACTTQMRLPGLLKASFWVLAVPCCLISLILLLRSTILMKAMG